MAAIKRDEAEDGREEKEAQREIPVLGETAGIQVHKENSRLQIPLLHSLLGGAIHNLIVMGFSFIGFRGSRQALGSLLKPQKKGPGLLRF